MSRALDHLIDRLATRRQIRGLADTLAAEADPLMQKHRAAFADDAPGQRSPLQLAAEVDQLLAERDQLRDALADVLGRFTDYGAGLLSVAVLAERVEGWRAVLRRGALPAQGPPCSPSSSSCRFGDRAVRADDPARRGGRVVSNDDERDYAEEAANRQLLQEGDDPAPVTGDANSRQLLADLTARHQHLPLLGCSLIAHRDLGFCAGCVRYFNQARPGDYGASIELAGWRLLAMAERGIPSQPARRGLPC